MALPHATQQIMVHHVGFAVDPVRHDQQVKFRTNSLPRIFVGFDPMCQRRAGLASQPQPAAPARTPSPNEQDATFWKVSSVTLRSITNCGDARERGGFSPANLKPLCQNQPTPAELCQFRTVAAGSHQNTKHYFDVPIHRILCAM